MDTKSYILADGGRVEAIVQRITPAILRQVIMDAVARLAVFIAFASIAVIALKHLTMANGWPDWTRYPVELLCFSALWRLIRGRDLYDV